MQKLVTLLASLTLVTLFSACDRPKYHVSGMVTYKNEPVPAGHVFFDPDASKNNDGPQGSATIKDGRYDTAAEGGKPVIGGPHHVWIRGYDGIVGEELPLGRPLFSNFSKQVDLPQATSTHDFNIPEESR